MPKASENLITHSLTLCVKQMETPQDSASTPIRRFLTFLFIERARSHLKTLAVEYDWSPERLLEYESRFIKQAELVPEWM